MSLNRIVALLTPLVFAPLAGVISTWAAENLPGVNIPAGEVEKIFIAGALIALAPAVQWLHGWQKWEARQAETQQALEIANAAPPTLIAVEAGGNGGGGGLFDESGEFDELDDLDALDDLDDFDEELLAEEEEPAPAGG
jgi:hypothetical protein